MRMPNRVTRHAARRQIRYVEPVPVRDAPPLVSAVYRQVERDFGMLAPPVALHAPAPSVLAACWMMLRESLLVAGSAGRGAKEAVAAGVSLGNDCPYCVQVHGVLLHGLTAAEDAAAIAAGRIEDVTDPALREVATWARDGTVRRRDGLPVPRTPSARAAAAGATGGSAPFPAGQAAEHVGVAVTFHYLNRMVNVFLGDPPIPVSAPEWLRDRLARLAGRLMRPVTGRRLEPGSAALLPAAPLPVDLEWAAGSPHVADAFARAATAVDEAGDRSVPDSVRALVAAELDRRDGRPPGAGRSWLEEPLSSLPAGHRPAGRLALVTALASYRVLPSDISGFRAVRPDDRSLVELTSWASLTAARRIGARLHETLRPAYAVRANRPERPAG